MALIIKEIVSIPKYNLLAEYRFDEGSGSILKDYSGNQNNGTYVGSPTFSRNGGFIPDANGSGPSKYAVGHNNFLSTAQTFYFVGSCNFVNSWYHPIMGNSLGFTNLNFTLSDPTNNAQFISLNVYGGTGSGSGGIAIPYDTVPAVPFIVAVTIDSSNVAMPKVYIEGKEAGAYYSRALNSSLGRSGTPWFGGSNTGVNTGGYNGTIYFAASYSDLHTDDQILNNTVIIREFLRLRGIESPRVANPTTTTPQILGLGSSTMAGYQSTPPLSLVTLWDSADKITRGFSGGSNDLSFSSYGFASLHFAPNAYHNIVWLQFGGNVATSRSQYRAAFKALLAAVKAFKSKGWTVLVQTVIDRGDSTGLTVPGYFDSMNSLIRGAFPPHELIDIAADPRFGTVGASSNTTYYNVDKIHLNSTGQQILADMGGAKINKILMFGGGLLKQLYVQNSQVTISNTLSETTCVGNGLRKHEWGNYAIIANTTSGSPTLATSQGSGFCVVGQLVTGAGIPVGSTVSSISFNTSITINNNATASNSSTQLIVSKIGVKKHSFDIGQSIVVENRGLLSTSGTPTLNKKLKLGSTTLGQTGVITLGNNLSTAPYTFEVKLTPLTLGTTASFIIEGDLKVYDSSSSVYKTYPINSGSYVSIDTTNDYIMDLTDTWGTATSSNIDLVTSLNIYRI